MAKSKQGVVSKVWDRVASALLVGGFRLLRRVPYGRRVPLGGWLVARVLGPMIGYRRRVRRNLALVHPEMPAAEARRLTTRVLDSMGRTVTELLSPDEFPDVALAAPITGPGLAAIETAGSEGRPVVLVSGHFGNYDAWRGGLIRRGFDVGGLYRRMNLTGFNDFYVDSITRIGAPLFLRGRRGMAEMIRFLREGGFLGLLVDQHMSRGEVLDFMGHPAATALSAAEMALKYDALLVPIYAVRQPDGMSFAVTIEAPIPHSDATTMMQAVNASLEAQVRAHPEQWLWTHRRWKVGPKVAQMDSPSKL